MLQRYYFREEVNNNVRYNFLLDNVTKVLFSVRKIKCFLFVFKFGTVISSNLKNFVKIKI